MRRIHVLIVCAIGLAACEEHPPPSEERSPDELSPPEVPPDPIAASGGFTSALHTEALRAREGRGVERDAARAAAMLEQGCDRGYAPSCIALAEMLEAGEGSAADPERARSILEQACHQGSTLACDRLGH